MARFILTIEASTDLTAGAAPLLEVLVDAAVVSSALITAQTGVGSNLLVFTLDFDDSVNPYPSSLDFRFNGASGDGNETVTIESVRINGQAINPAGDLTATMLTQAQTSSLASPVAHDHLFGLTEPVLADFDPPTITGTAGDDEIEGTAGADIVDSSNGNDYVAALDGDDTIFGGDGDDMLLGQDGNDIIIGGLGSDKIWGDSGGDNGDDLLFGQDGNDFLFGEAGNDVLNGGADNDVLIGGTGNDILYGEAGNDRLIGQTGNNSMYGGAGDDVLLGGNQDDLMYGGADNDTMHGGNGDDEMYGEDGDDFMTGGLGNDTLSGGAGGDTINGGNDNDTLWALDNGISAADADDGNTNILNGDAGNDTLHGSTGRDFLNGGTGDDTLYSGSVAAGTNPLTLFDNAFDADEQDMSYSDGGFGYTDPGNDVNGSYWGGDGGAANGSVQVRKDTASAGDASGSYDGSVTIGSSNMINGQITFSYRHWHSGHNDAGEDSYVYFSLNGTIIDTSGGTNPLSSAFGAGGGFNSGWITATIDLGNLDADQTYNFSIGLHHTGGGGNFEDAYVRIDDVLLTADEVIPANTTILNGQDGLDDLYGAAGIDHFIFENASAFNDIDTVNNFDTTDSDALDLSDILSNAGYNPMTDAITDFVEITDAGADSVVRVDVTGSASFGAGTQIATLIGMTGLTDEAALETAGNLITS